MSNFLDNAIGCLLIFCTAFIVFTVLIFLVIQLDMYLNGEWLSQVVTKWRWYNYCFSSHTFTALYLQSKYLWMLPGTVIALTLGLIGRARIFPIC